MKKWKMKIMTGFAFALAIGLCACGGAKGAEASKQGKDAEVTEELAPEYSYVAEYVKVPENLDFYNQVCVGNQVYLQSYSQNEEDGSYKSKIVRFDISDGELSGQTDVLSMEQGQNLNRFTVDENGNVFALLEERPDPAEDATYDDAYYENYYRNVKYHLVKYDAQGQKLLDEDVTEYLKTDDYFYVSYLQADGKGNCCIVAEGSGIVLFGADGKYLDIIPNNDYLQSMGMAKDGKIYFSCMSQEANGMKTVLYGVDFEQKKLSDPLEGFPYLDGNRCMLQKGLDGDILCFDQTCLYEYSFEKREATKLLTWMDCDVDGSMVCAVSAEQDGKLYAFLNNWNGDGAELVYLKKVKTDEIVKRENITIGLLYNDSTVIGKLVEFNKKSEKYHVSVKTYMDMNDWSDTSYKDALTNLTNDITSGKGPDILDLSGLDVWNLVDKGVVEDLKPYLEKSSVIDQNDIFPSLLKGATVNGTLAYIPSGFTLETLAAKTALVGDKRGWTCKDMMELAAKYPKAQLMQYCDKQRALQMMLMLGKEHFIDSAQNVCHFDTEDFKEVLRFVNAFPDEISYVGVGLVPNLLKDDSLLLAQADIYSFEEVQSVLAYFGDDVEVTFIGYPTYDGGNGCILLPSDSYGMSALSSHKEGAWAVLEEIFSAESKNGWRGYGFSSLRSKYEKQKEEALQVEYVYDENGEVMLDEQGNPIYEGGSGYTMVGDDGEEWSYVYRPIKAEEVDLVEILLKDATVMDSSANEELNQIIFEEAGAYFKGSKSVDEVAAIIQNRVNLYLKENE